MKKSPLRLVLILGMISITGALITQIFWLRKALNEKQADFDQVVSLSLRRVVEHIDYSSTNSIVTLSAVNKISPRKFKLNINDKIDCNVLEFYLRTELAYPSLDIDFLYMIYDANNDSLKFTKSVSMKETTELYAVHNDLPVFNNGAYYAVIDFPTRSAYIGVKMTIWIFSLLVLVIAVFFFAYSVLVIIRQTRLMEMQKDFINNMAHEFKTPIATISISAETISSPDIVSHPERLHAYTNIIKNETDRLRTQVDKLLQMAKMERDKIELHLEELDLHEMMKEVIPNLSLKLDDEHGKLIYHLDAAHHVIKADKVHLTNIIYNLLDNAVKYMEAPPVVDVGTKNQNGEILLSIRDYGIGIPEEYQDKVFDKFFRVPTGNIHNVKGFGLGLHYLKIVVNAHKWKLDLQSEPGKGSTFTISIPCVNSSADQS
ncbi:MAG TPA: HAMP domain-containing sensor histidine kinase [Chitinophagales bacterium]|nr:HAMP domain-containing sensor histidine kinase [Chitinophagales bacterium]